MGLARFMYFFDNEENTKHGLFDSALYKEQDIITGTNQCYGCVHNLIL